MPIIDIFGCPTFLILEETGINITVQPATTIAKGQVVKLLPVARCDPTIPDKVIMNLTDIRMDAWLTEKSPTLFHLVNAISEIMQYRSHYTTRQ